ncbi:hypothetical protein N0V88_004812 [Collariella sp. IMI 366227]|nr:hypothetical protein N0V88_004812 [Collariella sp. IMI 366227]
MLASTHYLRRHLRHPLHHPQIADIRLLLSPLAPQDVRTVRCLGLNYAAHAKESNMPIPKNPVGFDGWAPFGPGIVSSSLIKDPQTLGIKTRVNGHTVQDSTTADMIFSVKKTIAFLSQGTTLMPGDLIFTGTPQGVGMGRKPQVWLKNGDVVEVELEGVGTCTNKVEFTPARDAKL